MAQVAETARNGAKAIERPPLIRTMTEVPVAPIDQIGNSGFYNPKVTAVAEATPTREYSAIDTGHQKKILIQKSEKVLETLTNNEGGANSVYSQNETNQQIISQVCDEEFNKIDNTTNPFLSKEGIKYGENFETLLKVNDPLGPLKKGMLMSTYKGSSPNPSVQTKAVSGPDQSFLKPEGAYAGARRARNRIGQGSQLESYAPPLPMTSPNSICESYKNVDFFKIKEPYHVVKNKFSHRMLGPQ